MLGKSLGENVNNWACPLPPLLPRSRFLLSPALFLMQLLPLVPSWKKKLTVILLPLLLWLPLLPYVVHTLVLELNTNLSSPLV
jgi:hypothetical protein